ncbi:MAG: helix-turn-helix transcriptional regulator [Acinetobacter sp.]
MQKLIQKVAEAREKLGVSNAQLSAMIGHSKNYISESLRLGRSTETQENIIALIDSAIAGERFKTKNQMLDIYANELDEVVDSNAELRLKLLQSQENERHFRENFIQMQKKANVLNQRRLDYFMATVVALFVGLMFGFMLGVNW